MNRTYSRDRSDRDDDKPRFPF